VSRTEQTMSETEQTPNSLRLARLEFERWQPPENGTFNNLYNRAGKTALSEDDSNRATALVNVGREGQSHGILFKSGQAAVDCDRNNKRHHQIRRKVPCVRTLANKQHS